MTTTAHDPDFERLFALLPAPMVVVLPDAPVYTMVAVNEAYLAVTHTTRQQIIGHGLFEVFPEETADPLEGPRQLRASFDRARVLGEIDRLPLLRYDIPVGDGGGFEERYWIPINAPIPGADGKIGYIVHRVEDATAFVKGTALLDSAAPASPEQRLRTMQAELLRYNQELQRSHQRLAEAERFSRSLVENTPGVILRAGRVRPWPVRYASESIEHLTGYPASDFVDGTRTWGSVIHEADADRIVREGASQAAADLPLRTEYRIRRRNGSYRWVEARARFSVRDPEFVDVTVFDIDDRKRAESALRDSQEHMRHVLQSLPSVLWTATPDGAVDFVSDSVSESLGGAPSQYYARGWMDAFHPDDRAKALRAWTHCVNTGEGHDDTFRLRTLDGSYRWYQIRAHCGRDAEGRIDRWYGVNTDVQEIRRAQAGAEEAVRMKTAFLSAMSHEIRTPLNAVLGFAGLLADSELLPQQRDFVNSIRASGDHLLGVINDILDFSRLESASLSIVLRPCDLRQTVEAALDMVSGQAGARGLELVYTMDASVPAQCIADEARLRQVLVNLLANAVKFTPAGEVVLRVSAKPVEDDEYEFSLAVTDTGIGIPPDRIERLFREFSQVDDSAARRFGGSGLGLAISKRLVEAHGGTIDVQSEVGRGSTFRVRLRSRAPQAPAFQVPPALKGRRALIVDDNAAQLESISSQLTAWGLHVTATTDPSLAPQLSFRAGERGEPFDMALLDQHAPPFDALALAQQWRESCTPPPMVLLAVPGLSSDAEGIARSFAAVVTKPVHRAALLTALERALAGSPQAPRDAATTAPGAVEGVTPKSLKVLLAEDNLVNRKMALLLLKKFGYTDVDVAVDGLEALAAVHARAYDAVLMDIEMPNLDGLASARRIRAEVAKAQQPQIIALTANAMAEDRRACVEAGMDDYVPKPIDPQRLAQALREAAVRRGIELVAAPRSEPVRSLREDADARARRISDQVLAGGGATGALMRRIDWTNTPLGAVYTWPQSLRTALSILLTQSQPFHIWWGRELVQFYNDAARPMLGTTKHPAALGQRAQETWAEIWDVTGPMVERVMVHGESTHVERGLLCLNRNGLLEECYFSYGYSPIRDESGGIGGLLIAGVEVTSEVMGTRRNQLLLSLDESLDATGVPSWQRKGRLLDAAASDLPFVLVYRFDVDNRCARLMCATGLSSGSALAPSVLLPADPTWPVFEAQRAQRVLVVSTTAAMPAMRPWPEPPHRALVHPLGRWGAMVAGISPRLIADEDYRGFVARVAQRLQRMQFAS